MNLKAAAHPTSGSTPAAPPIPTHPGYQAAASSLRLAAVELVQSAFELGGATPTEQLNYRITRNVSEFVRNGDAVTIEFEVDVEAVNLPDELRLWASVARWRVTYIGATGLDDEPTYEVLVLIGFMTLYPYVRAYLGNVLSQTRYHLPPLPTATISAFGPVPPMSGIGARLPAQMIMRAPG